MLTTVAHDQRWPDVVAGILSFFKFCFYFVLLYNKSLKLMTSPLGNSGLCSLESVSVDFVSGNIEILRKQNSLFPLGPVIKC